MRPTSATARARVEGCLLRSNDALMKKGVRLFAIKEGIDLSGKQDLQTKVMVTMFGLFADIERELISMRTREGLAAARASGKQLGRPRDCKGKSKLDGREDERAKLLALNVSKSSIAKITGVDRATLHHFIIVLRLPRMSGITQSL